MLICDNGIYQNSTTIYHEPITINYSVLASTLLYLQLTGDACCILLLKPVTKVGFLIDWQHHSTNNMSCLKTLSH